MMRQAESRARTYGYGSVRIAHDLVYAEYGQRQLKLDLYQPPNPRGPVPGIIAIRGGAWREGDKEFFGYIAGHLAMEGFVAASIEYRTSDEARFPAAVQDAKAAVRWMRAHAAEFGVSPDQIGAIGGSAGAHLVAMLATSSGVKELEGSGGNAGISSDIQAAVAMGGAYDLLWKDGVGPEFVEAVTGFIGGSWETHRESFAAASPVTYVSRRSAPLLLLHSRTDPIAPFGQPVEMEERYRRVGAPVSLTAVDAPGIHGFWGDPRYFGEAKGPYVAFLHRYLKG
jgi:pectinesterase